MFGFVSAERIATTANLIAARAKEVDELIKANKTREAIEGAARALKVEKLHADQNEVSWIFPGLKDFAFLVTFGFREPPRLMVLGYHEFFGFQLNGGSHGFNVGASNPPGQKAGRGAKPLAAYMERELGIVDVEAELKRMGLNWRR